MTISKINTAGVDSNLSLSGNTSLESLVVSGTVSGTGFSNYLASPPAIGGTTPAAGTFSSLDVLKTDDAFASITASGWGTFVLGINSSESVAVNGVPPETAAFYTSPIGWAGPVPLIFGAGSEQLRLTPSLTTVSTALSVIGNTTLGDASADTLTINAGTTTFAQGTADGVLYLNGSKVATSGSGLTFNGTSFGVTNIDLGGASADGILNLYPLGYGSTWQITNSANALKFIYNASQDMTLTHKGLLVGYTSDGSLSGTGNAIFSGSVGIGTSSPSLLGKFAVVGGNIVANGGGTVDPEFRLSGASSGVTRTYAMGTDASQRLYWYDYTASAYRMVIDSSGNVGIGTNSPVYRLDVVGNQRIYVGSGTGNAYTAYANPDKNWYLGIRGDTSDTFCLSDDSAIRVAVDSSGNLGLGVIPNSSYLTAPSAIQLGQISVLSQDINSFYVNANASAPLGKYLKTGNYAVSYHLDSADGSHKWFLAGVGAAGDYISPSRAMTLTAAGNLLVNLTSGTAKTQIQCDGFVPSNSNVIYPSLMLTGQYGGGIVLNDGGLGCIWMQGGGTIMGFGVGTTSGVSGSLYIKSGNVGIGTNNPDSALHITSSNINNTATTIGIRAGMYAGGYAALEMVSSSGLSGWIDFHDTAGADFSERIRGGIGDLDFYTNGSHKTRINSSGVLYHYNDVYVGTSASYVRKIQKTYDMNMGTYYDGTTYRNYAVRIGRFVSTPTAKLHARIIRHGDYNYNQYVIHEISACRWSASPGAINMAAKEMLGLVGVGQWATDSNGYLYYHDTMLWEQNGYLQIYADELFEFDFTNYAWDQVSSLPWRSITTTVQGWEVSFGT